MMDPDEYDPAFRIGAHGAADEDAESSIDVDTWLSYSVGALANIQGSLSADVLALPGMKEAILKKAGIEPPPSQTDPGALGSGGTLSTGSNHFVEEIEINAYPVRHVGRLLGYFSIFIISIIHCTLSRWCKFGNFFQVHKFQNAT